MNTGSVLLKCRWSLVGESGGLTHHVRVYQHSHFHVVKCRTQQKLLMLRRGYEQGCGGQALSYVP